MYRIGACIPGASFMPQTGGAGAYAFEALCDGCEYVRALGYDFAEATVGTLTQLSEREEKEAIDRGIVIEVCNSFVPPQLNFFTSTPEEQREFVGRVMKRAARFGTEYIILGSGAARRVPDGVPENERNNKLAGFLKICSGEYGKYGVAVALEPLNYKETNCINKVSEGYSLVKELSLDGVYLLADAYHMYEENEPLSVLTDCEDMIRHIHVSQPDRAAPGLGNPEYLQSFFAELKKTAYNGRVSVECVYSEGGFKGEARLAFTAVKEMFNEEIRA